MDNSIVFAFFPLITLLFYIAPIVFIVWFLLRILKLQREKNEILKDISDKLTKR
ncbi:hypothetical protein GCM10007199_30990 [Fictibacillus barbaricus]|nr:hypothetical protein GCM10007199_30990 [Fictibacillus barbaricus]